MKNMYICMYMYKVIHYARGNDTQTQLTSS